jgi:hypothetical protein
MLALRAILGCLLATLLLTPPAHAQERELWHVVHHYRVSVDLPRQKAMWSAASDRVSRSCSDGEQARDALKHVRLTGAWAKSVQKLVQYWPSLVRAAGYDDSCAIASKLTRVWLAVSSINQLCGIISPCSDRFEIDERETKRVRDYLPDVCSWRISVGPGYPPTAVIKTLCA